MSRTTGVLIAVSALAATSVILVYPRHGFAQGWVVARQGAPVLGAQASPYLEPGEVQASLSYRYMYSHRHFVGDEEQHERAEEGSQVKNYFNLFDLTGTFAVTKRLNISVSLPYAINERSSPLRDENRVVVDRYLTHAQGIGDLNAVGRMWVLDPEECPNYNFSLGLGFKIPTGAYSQMDTRKRFANGKVETTTPAPVDNSIQPGDGGWGIIFDIAGFLKYDAFGAYLAGSYLSNPRGSAGVDAGNNRVWSVGDLYIARAGFSYALPEPVGGFVVMLGGRAEGQPDKDLIGNSEGRRRPGYAISLEPGLAYGFGKTSFQVQVPIALYRNRISSVDDERATPEGTPGDAAFSDWFLVMSVAHVFSL